MGMSIGEGANIYKYTYLLVCLSTLIFQTTIFDSFEQKECFSLVLDG